MPGVTVTLTNQATNVARVVQTNEVGLYVISAIPPGTYDLKAELAGFRTIDRQGLVVQVGSASRIAFTMDVGEVAETMTVVGQSPLIQTENAAISTVIENRAIVELPLNGRNYLQLASLIPGATTNGPSSSQGKQRMGGQRNSFALNVAGQRIHFNHYSLDGVENTDLNFNSYMLLPSVDALEEFNVISGIFDAEYGRAIAQVNVSTKSGSNQVRGTVFEFLRNSSLDAKNYFDRASDPIPPFKRNQYGFTLSGPVVLPKVIDGRNRLFFMANWEGLRENKSLTTNAFAAAHGLAHRRLLRPSRRERQPDPDLRPGDARVRRRRQRAAGADGRFPATSFRRIGFTPSRKSCSAYYPRPSQEVTGANFVNNEARQVNADQITYRLDFTHGPSTWTFRHSYSTRARVRSLCDPGHGNQHRHQRASARVQQHAHDQFQQAQRRENRLRVPEERAHLAARQHRERRQGPRHQPALGQSALLGRPEHQRHGVVRAR